MVSLSFGDGLGVSRAFVFSFFEEMNIEVGVQRRIPF